MNLNHLDARALNSQGGPIDALSNTLNNIAKSYFDSRDQQGRNSLLRAKLSQEDRQRNEDRQRQLAMLGFKNEAEAIAAMEAERGAKTKERGIRLRLLEDEAAQVPIERQRKLTATTGIVPGLDSRPAPLAPTDDERVLWSLADMHAEDRAMKREAAESTADQKRANLLRMLMGGGKTTDPMRNVRAIKDRLGLSETLVVVDPETGTYTPLRSGEPTEPDAPEFPADAIKKARAALERYHQGGWFGAGKGDAAPLAIFAPDVLNAAAAESGLALPSTTATTQPAAKTATAAEGTIIKNKQTGERLKMVGGAWVPVK